MVMHRKAPSHLYNHHIYNMDPTRVLHQLWLCRILKENARGQSHYHHLHWILRLGLMMNDAVPPNHLPTPDKKVTTQYIYIYIYKMDYCTRIYGVTNMPI